MKGQHTHIALTPRPVKPEEEARKTLDETIRRWKQAADTGAEPGELRILKSYAEGAGVALEFSRTMAGIQALQLPITVFSFAGLKFAAVPGELFSSLWNLDAVPICYANGYYRYIADTHAYDAGYYEAMAAILDRGQGEEFRQQIARMLDTL
jgi:hypothetical protein